MYKQIHLCTSVHACAHLARAFYAKGQVLPVPLGTGWQDGTGQAGWGQETQGTAVPDLGRPNAQPMRLIPLTFVGPVETVLPIEDTALSMVLQVGHGQEGGSQAP